MDIKIISQKETPLLSRKRVELQAVYNGPTPSRKTLLEEVSKIADVPMENIIIRHVYTKYGLQQSKIIAHIYKDRKTLEEVEDKHIVKKHKLEEKKLDNSEENTNESKEENKEENKEDGKEGNKEEAKKEDKAEEAKD